MKRLPLAALVLAALVIGLVLPAPRVVVLAGGAAPFPLEGAGEDEGLGGFYTLLGPDGNALAALGLRVHAGDQFLSEDNIWYEVENVTGYAAMLRRLPEALWPLSPQSGALPNGAAIPVTAQAPTGAESAPTAAALATDALATPAAPPPATGAGPRIRIYHTHSDESYTPSEGKSNIPDNGGIYKVGAAFQRALSALGFDAAQDPAGHEPHDEGAYGRSRRTAKALLNQQNTVLFDLHRDTAPASTYRRTIDGKAVTQIMFVVGRDNPGMRANLGFAKSLKDAADQVHPRLVRGIFMGAGNYNQDLSQRTLLLEVGSYTNRREEAEAGIVMFADAVRALIDPGSPQAAQAQPEQERRGQSSALAWVIGLAVLGGVAFLLLSSGGARPALERVKRLGQEFNDLLPGRKGRL